MAKNLKSFMKSTSILAILLIAILGTTFTAHALETYYGTIVTSSSWQTLASSTTGFNRNVTVFNSSTGTDRLGILKADILMLCKNGERLC